MCVVAGAPLAPPPSDATKPKIPSGPDLRIPGPSAPSLGPSLGATPQLASGPPPSPAKAADKVSKKVTFCTPVLPHAGIVTHTVAVAQAHSATQQIAAFSMAPHKHLDKNLCQRHSLEIILPLTASRSGQRTSLHDQSVILPMASTRMGVVMLDSDRFCT